MISMKRDEKSWSRSVFTLSVWWNVTRILKLFRGQLCTSKHDKQTVKEFKKCLPATFCFLWLSKTI